MSAKMKQYELRDYLAAQKEAFGRSPIVTLMELMEDARPEVGMITIRPSGIVEFFDNSLVWAAKQILGVSFGNSDATVIGSATHAGAHAGYEQLLIQHALPPERFCLLAVAQEARKQYKWIENPEMTLREIYLEAKRLFEVYYRDVMPFVKPVMSEERVVYEFKDREGNPLNIQLAGTPDRIARFKGKKVVRDLKTSKKGIGGKQAKVSDELMALRAQIKQYSARPKKSEELVNLEEILKVAKRRKKDSEDLTQLKAELKNQAKLITRKTLPEEEKEAAIAAAASLDEAIKASEAQKDKEHEEEIAAAQKAVDDYIHERDTFINATLERLNSEAEPLEEELANQQYENDCLAAKRKHGVQLAAYALLAQIVLGESIDTGVIELVVRYKDEPKTFTYEFDLSEYKLMLDEQLSIMIETIKAYKDGINPKILFRHNAETFRGSELTEMIYEVRDMSEDELEAA